MKYDKNIKNKIVNSLHSRGRGSFVFVSDFNFSVPKSIRGNLSRLVANGILIRIDRGIYYYPKLLAGKPIFPTVGQIAQAVADHENFAFLDNSYYYQNLLGLSQQVPMRALYLTNGSKKRIKFGKLKIDFLPIKNKKYFKETKGKISGPLILSLIEEKPTSLSDDFYIKISDLLLKEKKVNIQHDIKIAPDWVRKLFYEHGLAKINR